MSKVLIILNKEWIELRKQPLLLLGIILPPVILTIIIVLLLTQSQIGSSLNSGDLSALTKNPLYQGLSVPELIQTMVALQVSLLYILLPGILTSVIASYSIVGEKVGRTLEPILATPVRTWQLLVGKCLIALLPALVVTWGSALLFVVALRIWAVSGTVFQIVINPGWLVLVLLWAPLLAILSIAVMIIVSSRVNEPRTAQQFSIWILVPFMGLFFAQLLGLPVYNIVFTLSAALVLALLALGIMWLAVLAFQREAILTRWK